MDIQQEKKNETETINVPDVTENLIIGKNLKKLMPAIIRLAQTKIPIIIRGETGCGKTVLASLIHRYSNGKKDNFVSLNCGGIPNELVGSILFGHAKGSFTGATDSKQGKFIMADKGSLFLDECGNMTSTLQEYILKAIDEGVVEPIGAKTVKVSTRIISATNMNLEELIEAGKFRKDLFHRLSGYEIYLPSLKERREEIPELVDFFCEVFKKENPVMANICKKVVTAMKINFPRMEWPGNIRQLKNQVFTRLALGEFFQPTEETEPPLTESFETLSIKSNTKRLERNLMLLALKETGGNKTKAAEILEISVPALLYKMKEYEI